MAKQIRRLLIVAVVALALPLGACEGTRGENEIVSTLLGAALGGLVGAQFGTGAGKVLGAAIGTIAGGITGNWIGRQLDRVDRRKVGQAQHSALEYQPDNGSVAWSNPDTGNYGSFMPTSTVMTRSGQPCREFQQTITVGGQTKRAYGEACRDAGGQWRIAN